MGATGPLARSLGYLCHECYHPAVSNEKDFAELVFSEQSYTFEGRRAAGEPPAPAADQDFFRSQHPPATDNGGRTQTGEGDPSPRVPWSGLDPRTGRTEPAGGPPTPYTPARPLYNTPTIRATDTNLREAGLEREPRSAYHQFDKGDFGEPRPENKAREAADRGKLLDTVGRIIKEAIPVYAGVYDDVTGVVRFIMGIAALLNADPTVMYAISDGGIDVATVLQAVVSKRVAVGSYAHSRLEPILAHASLWKEHLQSTDKLCEYLGYHCLSDLTQKATEQKYNDFKFLPNEKAYEALTRLKDIYMAACFGAGFSRRHSLAELPAHYLRGVSDALQVLTTAKMEQYPPVNYQPDQMEGKTELEVWAMMTIVQNFITKEHRQKLAVHAAPLQRYREISDRQVSFSQPSGPNYHRRAPRRDTLHAMPEDNDDKTDEAVDGSIYGSKKSALLALPSPGRTGAAPVGKSGPPRFALSDTARHMRSKVAHARPRKPGPGEEGYDGCYNCQSKEHFARNCTQPINARLSALCQNPNFADMLEAEQFVDQGIHPEVASRMTNPSLHMIHCSAMLAQMYGINTDDASDGASSGESGSDDDL